MNHRLMAVLAAHQRVYGPTDPVRTHCTCGWASEAGASPEAQREFDHHVADRGQPPATVPWR